MSGATFRSAVDDPLTTEPAVTGSAGRAWAIDLIRRRGMLAANGHATPEVGSWIVEAPWAHPAWHSYWIMVMHLRELPGVAMPTFYVEGATHELWVYAINPEMERQPMLETGMIPVLTPMNFAAQITAEHDGAAHDLVEQAVKMICEGTLSPDTDFRQQWVTLFGDGMIRREDVRWAPPAGQA